MAKKITQEEWMEILGSQDEWNKKHLFSIFSLTGVPDKMLDVGCGTGVMVKMARKLGCEAYGVDQLEHPEDFLFTHDLTKPFSLAEHTKSSQVPMVLSIEVAEHIPKAKHDVFCDTVAGHLLMGGLLIFSSAFPGQSGEGHIGVERPTYWRAKFHHRGIGYKPELTQTLSLAWNNIHSPMMWLPCNVQVFKR